jgi:hypothetical protein
MGQGRWWPAALLVLALLGGGTAIAAIPSTAAGTFTGCVSKRTGALRVIDAQAGKACAAGETTISWSKGYRYRGAWSPAARYSVLDVVTCGGSSYLARTASANKVPSASPASWGLLAARGAPGPSGPRGPAGPGASAVDSFVRSGATYAVRTVGAFTVYATCEPSGNSSLFYLTMSTSYGPYDASGWVSTTGTNGALPQLISDHAATGSLQYSAAFGSAIDEHVVMQAENSPARAATFDLQMTDVNFSGVHECNVWGTTFPSVSPSP